MKNIFFITLLTSFLFSCNSTNVDNSDWSGTTNQSDKRKLIETTVEFLEHQIKIEKK